MPQNESVNQSDADEAREILERIQQEVRKVIVGQEELVEILLVALLSRGHSLLIGVPGLAKTRSVQALADAMELSFNRIQFTPDLLPSDITGSEILDGDVQGGARSFRFEQGPVFANLVLADEINRTPPRTQAALLESMQERSVTVGTTTHPLPDPFLVLATQNPIEQEGTFPLPEAQLDRFFFSVNLTYPDEQQEMEIVRRTTVASQEQVQPVATAADIVRLQTLLPGIEAADEVIDTAVRLVRSTRPGPDAIKTINEYVAWGAGPRGSQDLILGAKALALLSGRTAASLADMVRLLPNVLGHRVVLNFSAERDKVTVDQLIPDIRDAVTIAV